MQAPQVSLLHSKSNGFLCTEGVSEAAMSEVGSNKTLEDRMPAQIYIDNSHMARTTARLTLLCLSAAMRVALDDSRGCPLAGFVLLSPATTSRR